MKRILSRVTRYTLVVLLIIGLLVALSGVSMGFDAFFHNDAKVLVEANVPSEVWADGARVGQVPQWLKLSPGSHRVEVRAHNCRTYVEVVDVTGRNVLTISARLEPIDGRARVITRSAGNIPRPAWSPDGRFLALVSDWEKVLMVDVEGGTKPQGIARQPVPELVLVGWASDGSGLAFEEYNGPGQWFSNVRGQHFTVNAAKGRRVKWAPGLDGQLVVSQEGLTWHPARTRGVEPPTAQGLLLSSAQVLDAAVAPGGRHAAVVEVLPPHPEQQTIRGRFYVFDLASGKRQAALEAEECQDLAAFRFSPRGTYLVAIARQDQADSYEMKILNAETQTLTAVDEVALGDSSSFCWNQDETCLVYSSSLKPGLHFWAPEGTRGTLDVDFNGTAAPAFLDARTMVFCTRAADGDRYNVDLWLQPIEVEGGRLTRAGAPSLIAQGVFEPSVAVSADGKLAFSTSDGAVWVWER